MARELGQVSGWGGRWRAGVGAGMATCTEGLAVENSPSPEVGRDPGGGGGGGERNQRSHLGGRAFGALGPPAVKRTEGRVSSQRHSRILLELANNSRKVK